MSIFLSTVIPCYNEEKNLRSGVLEEVAQYLKRQKYLWEVIVVDDGSTDESVSLIEHFIKEYPSFSLIKNPHQGKAATVITGMLKAKGDCILFTDLDQATPISEIEKFFSWFKKGFDVVIGSRSSTRQGAPLSRILMARGFVFLRRLILGLSGISDSQCGFKAFRNRVIKTLIPRLRLYGQKKLIEGSMVTAGFDIELLYLSKKLGFRIKEVPIIWHYVETRKVNPIKDSWGGFLDLIKIHLNDMRHLYD